MKAKYNADYYSKRIDTLIYRLYTISEQTDISANYQIKQLEILQKEIYDKLTKR
tara:strand:- start:42 stop:203 length:162 start_codon:yes stop_codon:yes gene_type:complete